MNSNDSSAPPRATATRWSAYASTFRRSWHSHYHHALWIAITVMVGLAVARHAFEFWRLFSESYRGAIDVRGLHQLVHAWFAHQPVYDLFRTAVYPPASYAILWPFLGWLSFPAARWLWAGTTIAAIVWLACLVARESAMRARMERIFAVLFFVSMYATAITVGNGQLILHILPALLTAALLLQRGAAGWGRDLMASFLFLATLVKPSVSAPFVWIVLFVPGSVRPFVLVSLGYVGLTVWCASYQSDGLVTLLHDWLGRGALLAGRGGYGNLHIWLSGLGMEEARFPASLVALLLLGVWTYRHRHGELWHLLGVSAIVARVWTYHRLYDDLLILFPIVALFRTVKSGPHADQRDVLACLLLAPAWVLMLAPGTLARLPWGWPFRLAQVSLWTAMLVFLLYEAAKSRHDRARSPGQ